MLVSYPTLAFLIGMFKILDVLIYVSCPLTSVTCYVSFLPSTYPGDRIYQILFTSTLIPLRT